MYFLSANSLLFFLSEQIAVFGAKTSPEVLTVEKVVNPESFAGFASSTWCLLCSKTIFPMYLCLPVAITDFALLRTFQILYYLY